jgi:gamma-tubulin complex component 4
LSISHQPFSAGTDASKSILMNASLGHHSTYNISKSGKGVDGGIGEVRRHVERLLLRLDFNGHGFSKALGKKTSDPGDVNILAEGGL